MDLEMRPMILLITTNNKTYNNCLAIKMTQRHSLPTWQTNCKLTLGRR